MITLSSLQTFEFVLLDEGKNQIQLYQGDFGYAFVQFNMFTKGT